MNISYLYILHVISAIIMIALNFYAFAAQIPDRRKTILMRSGIASLFVFLSGFAIHGMQKVGFPGWIIVKIICWFILSALAGMAYRFRNKIKVLMVINFLAVLTALTMVYLKPF